MNAKTINEQFFFSCGSVCFLMLTKRNVIMGFLATSKICLILTVTGQAGEEWTS